MLLAVAFVIYALVNQNSGGTKSVGSIPCNAGEQLAVHYHAHLTIIQDGVERTIPGNIGVTSACLYWLHTHDTSGVIHIEAPADRKNDTFTLGQFFQVWGQPLDSRHVATLTLSPDQTLVAYVDGKIYSGDPNAIPLKSHEQIVLEIQPPAVDPPPTFTWPDQYPK